MRIKIIIFLFLNNSLFFASAGEKARFDNYRVYELNIENEKQLELMRQIENYPDGYRLMDFADSVNSNLRIIVPPHQFGAFSEMIEKFDVKSRLVINNLQEVLDSEQPKRRRRATLDWTHYWTLSEINNWMQSLTEQYPNDVSMINIGNSYEGRPILGVKVNINNGANKKSVMFEGTHHAREWISAATNTWMLNELLTSNDTEIRTLANAYEWYIFPVTNPDGYEYSWTTNRLWRKTRRPTTNILCTGIDLNRNWDNFFNQGGTSMNPCSDTYAGEHAFSEPEARLLADFIETVPNLAVYIPFHSFSQILMLPYGWTHELLENYDEIYAIGEKALVSLKSKYGTEYRLGAIANVIYIATGASIDWVKYELKVNVTLEYEMRDKGTYGFTLPATQIIENSIEVFASIVTILQESRAIGIA